MKTIKITLIAAIILATGAAFATKKENIKADQLTLWGRTQSGGWVETTEEASCTASEEICKYYFQDGQDPNDDDSNGIPATTEPGYVQ